MAYPGSYPQQSALNTPGRTFSGRGSSYPISPRTPASTYDDFSRYPYGEPRIAQYDDSPDSYTGYGDVSRRYSSRRQTAFDDGYWQDLPTQQTPYKSPAASAAAYPSSAYATPTSSYTTASRPSYGQTPRLGGYYGNGAYDDLALNRSTYNGNNDCDRDYTSYNAGSLTPGPRPRRTSSVSFGPQYSSQPRYFDNYGGHRGRTSIVKFRQKGSLGSGMTLATAVAPGTKLSGGDYLKWHEINADARGRIYLKVKWNGYAALTYEIPVDGYEGRVRLSSLCRRVSRAIIHFMAANSIPISWDRVKLYHLEEVTPGTWQPALTVR